MRLSSFIFFVTLCFYGFTQMPKNLIVAAENLNFREEPNTESRVLDQLDNSELLETLELVKKGSWIKVRRKITNEVGYVFGKYVLPQNVAYPNFFDAWRIQNGNWYGIVEEENQLIFKSITPQITVEKDSFIHESYIHSNEKNVKYIFCSQIELNPKKMSGQIMKQYQGKSLIPIGGEKTFELSDKLKLNFSSSGVKSDLTFGYDYERVNKERVTLTIIDSKEKRVFDLSKDLLKFGESGYYLNFLGDLNDDGIPDFFLQEATTHGGAFYFFMSNENGEIELQSITWSSSKC